MSDFRRILPFCLEKRLSKHKMTVSSKNLGGMAPFPPLATAMAPVLQHGQLTLQTDLSSCGVCVCYTIDEIESRSLNLRHAHFRLDDFRVWMAYTLTQASTTCHIWIKQFLENHNIAKPGLPNALNNCWFNSAVQGIQSTVSCSSMRSPSKWIAIQALRLNNLLKTLL